MSDRLARHSNRQFYNPSNLSQLVDSGKGRMNQTFHSARSHSQRNDLSVCLEADSDFRGTASKLQEENFGHHVNCLCRECHCGRHTCKLHIVKPDLTKTSVYQRSFYKQDHVANIVNHDKEYDRLQGPHLDINSTNRTSYLGKNGDDLQRPHPEDLIHAKGPCPQLTTYSSFFPGHYGDNQYVKPTDKHARAPFPLRSKSTYTKEFIKKLPEKDDYTYFNDQLKTGYNWFGKTTYGSFFGSPNPEYHAKKVKVPQPHIIDPLYDHQYETVYRHEYVKKKNPLCPAKILLETKDQGAFEKTKQNFSQNTDFKALSPEFHAISTSKHSYV